MLPDRLCLIGRMKRDSRSWKNKFVRSVEKDIDKLGDLMIARIEEKRDALGI